ncbi:MAG: response regulator transcription factor [Armatimonadetes bacterium]|nr:response regulator transcription factor [Armatimonadota bacterium]
MNAQRIRVLIVDDHTIVREGIVSLLRNEADIEVAGESGDGRDAIAKVAALRPDVVILDVALPGLNGLEVADQIRRDFRSVRVVMLTMYENEEYLRRAARYGVAGYVLKEAAGRDLVRAIREAHTEQTTLQLPPHLLQGETLDTLTPREREVLQLVAEGHTNKEIADILFVSVKTIETHRLNLMSKLDMHDRTELVKFAIRSGLVSPDA